MEICMGTVHEIDIMVDLALRLWPDNERAELKEEFLQLVPNSKTAIFLAKDSNNFIGFAQCQLRTDYVEGTESSPVGYLEGIYVNESYRGTGIAKLLLDACEQWAREKGCQEFASDVELNNSQSLNFHLKHGFTEANRIICLTKKL